MTQMRALAGLGVLVFGVLCFGAGRFLTPPKVETVERVVEKVVVKEIEKRVEIAAKAKVVYVDRVVTKEGEVRERVVTKEVESTKTNERRETEGAVDVERAETKTATAEYPRLTIQVLAGVDVSPAWQPIPNGGPVTLGASVSYRVAGPVTVGVWGIHTGALGVSVGAQF